MSRFIVGKKPHNVGERDAAKARGAKRYFTGVPCPRGHISERSIANGLCIACAAQNMAALRAKRSEEQRARERETARVRAAEWRKRNPDHEGNRVAKRKWNAANKDRKNADTALRRASLVNRIPSWLTDRDRRVIKAYYSIAAMLTRVNGEQWHVDHIIPLRAKSASGLHVPSNLQLLRGSENASKQNTYEVA